MYGSMTNSQQNISFFSFNTKSVGSDQFFTFQFTICIPFYVCFHLQYIIITNEHAEHSIKKYIFFPTLSSFNFYIKSFIVGKMFTQFMLKMNNLK